MIHFMSLILLFTLASCGGNGEKSLSLSKVLSSSRDQPAVNTVDFEYNKALAIAYAGGGGGGGGGTSTVTSPVSCGDIITLNDNQSFELTHDLDCSSYSGAALIIHGGVNSNIDGDDFSIDFSNNHVGIIFTGSNVEIKNFELNGNGSGIGILAFNAQDAAIENNVITNAAIGINAYSEISDMGRLEVNSNIASGSSLFGLYVNTGTTHMYQEEDIRDNDFSNSGSYAMHLTMEDVALKGTDMNLIDNSQGGIYFSGGSLDVRNWDLANIEKTFIMGFRAQEVTIDKSTITGNGATALQTSMGYHFCEVLDSIVTDVEMSNMDVGIKGASNGGIQGSLEVDSSEITNMSFAGIMVQSYDGTSFGELIVNDNDLTNNAGRGLYEVLPINYVSKTETNNTY